MVDMPIKLSALWIAFMLAYLLGEVLRIYIGDILAGKWGNLQFTQGESRNCRTAFPGPGYCQRSQPQDF
jgi:hypothetical protein